MNAAAHKLGSLGIHDLVKDFELSELGNHVAATLRDMTSKKRKSLEGRCLTYVFNLSIVVLMYSNRKTRSRVLQNHRD